jgi:hypothetical protein
MSLSFLTAPPSVSPWPSVWSAVSYRPPDLATRPRLGTTPCLRHQGYPLQVCSAQSGLFCMPPQDMPDILCVVRLTQRLRLVKRE